ncbi:MAG: NUDIX domain-containing protein [Candidatus Kerfeldbacteria bacterium]|nr:NUDIX domain-containing protein [Candidatus Kerfeldbacteria bacterium]
MVREKSVGAVIFHNQANQVRYLLVQYRHGVWEFVRGHVEGHETEHHTAVREIREETGLRGLTFIPGFRQTRSWTFTNYYHKRVRKEVVYFLAETKKTSVQLDDENLAFSWLPFRSAQTRLSYPPSKVILKSAHQFLMLHHNKQRVYARRSLAGDHPKSKR